MPTVVIQQGISPRDAKEIIKELSLLLVKRRENGIGRKSFLRTYSDLRQELSETVEYAQFHYEVVTRACGMCEREGCTSVGKHVHHRKPVSRRPDLALQPGNGELVCVECHQEYHPDIEIAA